MTTVIDKIYEYAQLAQASYAPFSTYGGASVRSALVTPGGGFTEEQSLVFTSPVSGYTLADHQQNTAEGFSASVFKDASGKYVMAVRGTEMDLAGVITDVGRTDIADIGLNGIAISQAVDLFNYYQRLTAVSGQSLVQYQYVDGPSLPGSPYSITSGHITYSASVASETGVLAGKDFTVTGHSLGGHLAMIMGRLAGDFTEAVYTYNAPGFDVAPSLSNTEWFFATLKQAQIEATGQPSTIAASFNVGKITNLVVPGDVISEIGTVPGKTLIHFDESLDPSGAHSIIGMADSLVLQSLFAKIDSNLTLDTLSEIFKASSVNAETSLEKSLDALRNLFGQGYLLGKIDTDAPATAMDDRDQFYINLYALKAEIDELGPTTSSVKSLAGMSGGELADLAKNDIAYRYALYKLNPFAVTGDDRLYSKIEGNGGLDLYDRQTGTGQITQQWLTDRAELLHWKQELGLIDRVTSADDPSSISNGRSLWLEDRASEQTLYLGSLSETPHIVFGRDDYDDILLTGARGGRLYGGGGNDQLTGLSGDDYLEGGADNDALTGRAGADTLIGMDGNDAFNGGTGNDLLDGGSGQDVLAAAAGNDRYVFDSGYGQDTIEDEGGQNTLQFGHGFSQAALRAHHNAHAA